MTGIRTNDQSERAATNRLRKLTVQASAALLAAMFAAMSVGMMASRPAAAHSPHDDVMQIAASPDFKTDGTLFVIVRDRLMRSVDGGENWRRIVNGIDRPRVIRVAFAPSDSGRMYAVFAGGVYASTTKGSSWQPTAFGARTDIADVVVSATSPDTAFATGKTSGLFRTTNGGVSWAPVGSFGRIAAIDVSATSQITVGLGNGGLSTSTDDGASWTPSTAPPGTATITTIDSLADAPNLIFAGGSNGRVYISTDSGATFTLTGAGIPVERITGIALSIDFATDQTIWLSSWYHVWRSTDGGATFAQYEAGLTTDQMADDMGVPDFRTVATFPGVTGPVVLAGTFDGLARLDRNTDLWQPIQTEVEQIVGLDVSPAYTDDGTVIAMTYIKGAYVSRDRGANWTGHHLGLGANLGNDFLPLQRMHNVVFSPNYANDSTVFTAAPREFAKSTDGGYSWTRIRVEPDPAPQGRFVIAVSPQYATDQTIVVGTEQGRIYRSNAGGEPGSWIRLGGIGHRIRNLVMSPSYPVEPDIYAGTLRGVYKSSNGGSSWALTGPAAHSVVTISPNYTNDRTVYSGHERGLWITRNAGATWTRNATAPLSPASDILAIGLSPSYGSDGVVLVSVNGRGLLRSNDHGNTFTWVGASLITDNLLIADYEHPTSNPIQFSPSFATDGTVYGSTDATIVKSTDGGFSWTNIELPPAAALLSPPSIAMAPAGAAVVEGDSGTTRELRVPIDLSHPLATLITVRYQTLDNQGSGTASSSAGDFDPKTGTLVFTPGKTRQFVAIVVNGDAIDEDREAVVVRLFNPANATIGGSGLARPVILDDDPGAAPQSAPARVHRF